MKLAALLFAGATLCAQTRLTLEEAERTAVRNNPDVAASLLNAAAANQVTLEVRSALLPAAYASVTGAGALSNTRLAAGGLNNPTVFNRLAGGLNASQLISDFGRTSNLTASARLHAEARAQDAKTTRADIILQVDRAYFASLRAASIVTVAQQTVQSRQLVADQINSLAQAQLKSGLDVSFANVNLAEAKLLLLNAQSDLQAANTELSTALGLPATQIFTLVDPPQPGPPPADSTQLMRDSLAHRPELASIRADYAAAQRFVTAEHDLRNPTISALASGGYVPAHDINVHNRYLAAGVNMNIPIFNGHLFSAREAEAELRSEEVGQNVKSLENRISRDVQLAYLNADAAYRRVALTAELAAQATQGLELAQARYDLGLSSIVELSQAQLSKTSADIANTSSRYEYQLQLAVLGYQTGSR